MKVGRVPVGLQEEVHSLRIRVSEGCAWNQCCFCTDYKHEPFSLQPVESIIANIKREKKSSYGFNYDACFIQDVNAFQLEPDTLVQVLQTIKESFPSIQRISTYGRASMVEKWSDSDLQKLLKAGLTHIYYDMDSGSDSVLSLSKKGLNASQVLTSAQRLQKIGLQLSVFVVIGLGGAQYSDDHISESARLLRTINPHDIKVYSLAVTKESPLQDLVDFDLFTPLTEAQMVEEQFNLLNKLCGVTSSYGNYHRVGLFSDIKGRLPADKDRFIGKLKTFLELPEKDQNNFVYGKRMGYYYTINDFQSSESFQLVDKEIGHFAHKTGALEDLFSDMRTRLFQ